MSNNKKSRTTESLRETLFDTIEEVRAGSMRIDKAKVIGDLAKRILDTADTEMKFAGVQAALSRDKRSVEPVKLTGPVEDEEPEPAGRVYPGDGAKPNRPR